MSAARNASITRRFHDEVINGTHWDVARELLAPDVVHLRGAIGATIADIDPDGARQLGTLTGADRFIAATKLLRSLFPRWESQIQQLVAAEDSGPSGGLVFTKCLVTGEIKEGFRGGLPGKSFELSQAVVQRIHDGRIVEIWALSDQLDFWRALGARGV